MHHHADLLCLLHSAETYKNKIVQNFFDVEMLVAYWFEKYCTSEELLSQYSVEKT